MALTVKVGSGCSRDDMTYHRQERALSHHNHHQHCGFSIFGTEYLHGKNRWLESRCGEQQQQNMQNHSVPLHIRSWALKIYNYWPSYWLMWPLCWKNIQRLQQQATGLINPSAVSFDIFSITVAFQQMSEWNDNVSQMQQHCAFKIPLQYESMLGYWEVGKAWFVPSCQNSVTS